MPPKKRPAAAGAATTAAKRKKVSIGGTSIMGEPDPAETHASGRPKRSSTGEPTYNGAATKNNVTKTTKSGATASPAKAALAARGRGRPRKESTAQTEEERTPAKLTASPGKPVGRPQKSARSKFTHVKSHSPGQTARQTLKKATRSPQPVPAAAAKLRGRPKTTTAKTTPAATSAARAGKSKAKPKSTKVKAETTERQAETEEAEEEEEELDGLTANESDWDAVEEGNGKQYWLMKAEPDSRLEKGVDVKFSIDDLMNAEEPEGWDGVRNPAARNNMRAMKKGDMAFFYHSSCKIPGVAGIMEIVEEHSVDESAFDPASPYHDPKSSRDNPKWELVHVQFVRKLSKLIPLTLLKSYASPGHVLENLQMLKQTRLSVSAVKPAEWNFIMGLEEDDEAAEKDDTAVRGQVVNVHEEVVRDVNSEAVNGYDADGGEDGIKSRLTTASSTGKEDIETDA